MSKDFSIQEKLTQQFINNKWVAGKGGKAIENRNPYNNEIICEHSTASKEQIDQACQSAKKSQLKWKETPVSAKAALLNAIADKIEERKEEIRNWIIKETGGTYQKAELELQLVQACFRSASSLPAYMKGEILPTEMPGKESRSYKVPKGVLAMISPWNFPLQLTARSIAPAIATGNSVVIKASSQTPVTGGTLFAALFEEVEAPEGLIQVLTGSGSDVGTPLIEHEIPSVVSFTGSTEVGRKIGEAVMKSSRIKDLELELGGNNPIIILEDANLEDAVEGALFGRFFHNGQICMSANRIIVEKGIKEEFTDKFVKRVKELKVGDPSSESTHIGPIINDSQKDNIVELIEAAKKENTCLVSGDIDDRLIPPHVFTDVTPDSKLFNNEIFGPVASIIEAKDSDHAIELANDTDLGLSSAIFSTNVEKATQMALKIEAGVTHINDQTVNDLPLSPFGGEKNSGLGRFNGEWSVRAFTTDHWVSVQHESRPYWRKN